MKICENTRWPMRYPPPHWNRHFRGTGSRFVCEYARTSDDGLRTDGGPSNPNHLLDAFPVLFPYGDGRCCTETVSFVEISTFSSRRLELFKRGIFVDPPSESSAQSRL
ncbi:hypothetical protein F5146DRAFT_1017045, partial [Armillaria mellea]